MTLSLKIKHTGVPFYAASVIRDGSEICRLQPGDEKEVTLWNGSPLSVVEVAPDKKSE